MHITQCVLAFLSMYVGLAHSFTWEIVVRTSERLEFYDVNGTLTHTENVPPGYIETVTYDPVHNRVLFADFLNIYSFKIASRTIENLVKIGKSISSISYDPVTELLFWIEGLESIHSISLKTGFNNRTNEKQLIRSDPAFNLMVTVDICGGFIHWISQDRHIQKSRFDGSEKKIVTTSAVSMDSLRIHIDQQTHKIYWYEDNPKSLKCADLNGKNTIALNQVRPPLGFDTHLLAFSKDHIYLAICSNIEIPTTKCSIWKYPKNAPSDIDVLSESNLFVERYDRFYGIAVKYSIEDLTRGVQNCERVKSLLPNNSVTNVSSDASLLCVHGTKVSGESRCECTQGYRGERCDILNISYFLNFNLTVNLGFGIQLLDGHLKKVAETSGELSVASAIPVHSST